MDPKELMLTAPGSDFQDCFRAAVENIQSINTVACDYSVYNATGLLNHPYMLRAGGNYETPWTRDASVNTWNCLRFLDPRVARTTLLAVCTLDDAGRPIIQPDSQTWDQIVWAVGAWSYCQATGDRDFLTIAYGIVGRALKTHRRSRFLPEWGLYRGGSFFNDGISGYPLENHQPGLYDSFGPAHPAVEQLMCLSTNCLYCRAYEIYARMARLLGEEETAREAMVCHGELKDAINRHFWNEALGRYHYIRYPDGRADDSQEAAGHTFAVLFDICPEERQRQLLLGLTRSCRGLVSIHPPFPGLYSDEAPGRHNNVIWPFLNGMFIQAAAKCGLVELAGRELEQMTALFKGTDYHFWEIYSPYTGREYGGWQLDHVWDSCQDQTWSAACYIGAVVQGVFGVDTGTDGITFRPCVPRELRDARLTGLRLRDMELTLELSGSGSSLKRVLLDGVEAEPFLPYGTGAHTVTLVME